jgi:hypothetical protein
MRGAVEDLCRSAAIGSSKWRFRRPATSSRPTPSPDRAASSQMVRLMVSRNDSM